MWIVANFFFSTIWALLLSAILIAILYNVIRGLFPLHSLKLRVIGVLTVTFAVFFWQSVCMIGAIDIKEHLTKAEMKVSNSSNNAQIESNNENTNFYTVKTEVSRRYPFLATYTDQAKLGTFNSNDNTEIHLKTDIKKHLNGYIRTNIIWIIVAFITAFMGLYYICSISIHRKNRQRATDMANA